MKKILVTTIGIMLIAAACNNQAAVSVDQNQTANNSTETVNWKTYTNAKYGFSLQLSNDLSTTDLSNGVCFYPSSISIKNNEIPNCDLTFSSKSNIALPNTRKTVDLNGIRFTYYESANGVESVAYNYELNQNGKVFNFNYTGVNNHFDQITQILSTFKFTTPVSTANWKTYTNAKYGFSFKYPSDMVVVQEGSSRLGATGTVYSVKYPDSKWSYAVDVKTNTSKETLNQAFDENYNFMKQMVTPDNLDFQLKDYFSSDIMVDGMNAKELYIDHFGDVGSTMVSVVTNSNVYLIAGGGNKGDLDNFLSTFKFTK